MYSTWINEDVFLQGVGGGGFGGGSSVQGSSHSSNQFDYDLSKGKGEGKRSKNPESGDAQQPSLSASLTDDESRNDHEADVTSYPGASGFIDRPPDTSSPVQNDGFYLDAQKVLDARDAGTSSSSLLSPERDANVINVAEEIHNDPYFDGSTVSEALILHKLASIFPQTRSGVLLKVMRDVLAQATRYRLPLFILVGMEV